MNDFKIKLILLSLLCSFFTTEVFAIIPVETSKDKEITKLLQSQEYETAIQTITDSFEELSLKDYYLYVLGNSYYILKNYDKAIETFDRLLEEYPDSTYCNVSITKKAYSLVNKDNLLEAYVLYKERLDNLLSDDRRFALSQIYIDLANVLTTETEEKIPNSSELQTGITYYNNAKELGISDDIKDEIDFNIAYANYRINKNAYTNSRLFETFIETYPETKFMEKALYYAGDIYKRTGYYVNAREKFIQIYTDYPDSEFAAESVYNTLLTYGLPNISNIRNLELVTDIFNILEERYSDSEYTKLGLYDLAKGYSLFDSYFSQSIDLFNKFFEKYKEIDEELAANSLLSIGSLYYNKTEYDSAKKIYLDFIQKYPSHSKWRDIQNQLITINYIKAYNLYLEKKYEKAITDFNSFMEKYPIDYRNPDIMYMIGDTYYQREMWEDAIDYWTKTVSKYPNTSPAAKSQYYIGLTYEEKLGKLKEAKEAYEKVAGDYSYENMAWSKIETLTKKELNLQISQVFTTKDNPYIDLGLRNIDKVNVRIYNLDLKEYFLSKYQIRGIEDLDIILIKPDHSFDVTFEDKISEAYEDYKYFDSKIELPVTDIGSYVVYVESEEYKSMVLLLVSDIALSVKSTYDDVIMHTKNISSETSEPEVNILVQSNNKVVKELVSDENGFAFLNLKELRDEGINTNTIRYFAYKGNHYSSLDLYTGGIYTPAKTEKTSYIFTDKNKYKPGDTVYFKAIMRELNQGIVQNIDDKKFNVILYTSKEGQIYETATEISKYGTIYGSIELPKTLSSSGNYLTLKIQSDNYSFSKPSIPITIFKPAERELKIDFDKKAYKLGEKIKATITGSYLSGAPTNDVAIQYYVTDDPEWTKATLNESGQIEIELDSAIYKNYDSISINTTFTDDPNTMYSGATFIILKDFSISLKTKKDTFLPTEDIEITVCTKDYVDQPISKELTLKVYRTSEETGIKHKEIETAITTDENGEHVFKYSDSLGGQYEITFEGVGSNGIPVQQTVAFRIISSEGGSPIEILPEGLDFKVGETKIIKVYSKVSEGLALLTIERAKILEYRLISLKEGINDIEVSVDEIYSPNSIITIGLVKQDGYYHATKEINVESGIDIKIETDNNTYSPASEVNLSIDTKDIYGNPISTEAMVVVVDDAILKATNTTYANIKDAFYRYLYLNFVTQNASTPYTYMGLQNQIDVELLQELQRRDEEKEEKWTDKISEENKLYSMPVESTSGQSFDMSTMGEVYAEEEMIEMDDYDDNGLSQTEATKKDYRKKEQQLQPSLVSEDGESSLLRVLLKDTAFFKPDLVTDENGKAEIKFTLPDNLTRWKIFVIANNDLSLFGMNNSSIISTRQMVVNVDSPLELVEGDEFTFNINIQNNSNEKIEDELNIELIQEDNSVEGQIEQIEIKPKSSKTTATKTFTAPKDNFKLQATASLDGEVRDITLHKWESKYRKGIDGFTTQTITKYLDTENYDDTENIDKTLFVKILPISSQILRQMKNSKSIYFIDEIYYNTIGVESIIQELIVNLNLYKYLTIKETDNKEEIESLEKEIKHNIAAIELLGTKGYWGYSDDQNYKFIDYNITALAFFSLAKAQKEEFKINESIKAYAADYLMRYYRQIYLKDIENAAFIVYALSEGDAIDYTNITNLFNSRSKLSTQGLGFLSLALHNLQKKGDSKVINESLISKVLDEEYHIMPELPDFDYISNWYLTQSIGMYALLQTEMLSPELESRINEIIANVDNPFKVPNFLTFASLMYYKYLLVKEEGQSDFLLRIKINDQELFNERVNQKTIPIELSTKELTEKNKIEIEIEGKAELSYQAYIEYIHKNTVLENLNNESKLLNKWKHYPQYSIKIDDDKYPIYKNYDIFLEKQPEEIDAEYLNSSNSYDVKQEITKVPKDSTITITLNAIYTSEDSEKGYYIIEDYVPAGFILIENSVTGAVIFKQVGNRLFFYIKRDRNYSNIITYNIQAKYLGKYRTYPSKYYNSRYTHKEIVEEIDMFEVVEPDYYVFTDYKISPYEFYPIACKYYELNKYDEALPYFIELLEKWNIKSSYRQDIAYKLLKISLDKSNHENIIKYYEILKYEFSKVSITLKDLRLIAESYDALNEGEKAYDIIETLYRQYFGQEFKIVTILMNQQKYTESYNTALKIIKDYPDLPLVRNGLYSYSQLLYYKLVGLGITNKEKIENTEELLVKFLYEKTLKLLTAYLTLYSDSFNTDEVSVSIMNLYFDIQKYDQAYQSGMLFIDRFKESQFLDDYLYLSGLALFSNNKTEEAMKLLEKVAYEKFKDSDGKLKVSPNRLYALRLIGQSLHSQGQIEKATEIYKEIRNIFADAQRTLEILQHKVLNIEDILISPVEEKTVMTITHKNVSKITTKIYKVDFVILALTEKNLSDITKVNLSGIKPLIEKEYELTYSENYLPDTTSIELPIAETGAYLLVIRSDLGERSAIILKTNLKMDILESNGRVRVIVTDNTNRFMNNVKMYFRGSGNNKFEVTQTDIRGIAEALNMKGYLMIVGELNGEYLFYRGKKYIESYYYGTEYQINDLKEVNMQRDYIQTSNISRLNSIVEQKPTTLRIEEIYDEKRNNKNDD